MTDMGCMFQDIQIISKGFSVSCILLDQLEIASFCPVQVMILSVSNRSPLCSL